ncbi:hypothetical protein EDC04DRAFT_2863804 [Pisolithus marmoratus]|nr:hypothetical protein EDC04DRAFT_2863804 [Pisolithus marmoratus]
MDKADLETYQVQLSQVELALETDPDNEQLSSLRSELKELISLAQEAIAKSEAAASASSVPTFTYSGDGSWYPARIISVGGSTENPVYSIVFRGYNTTELVKGTEIKPLPANYQDKGPAAEEEREKKKKKNEKKLEAKAAKAKEQMAKQAQWQKFAKKAEKKGGTSIFKTPDNPLGRVGVTGSGKGMTEVKLMGKHKFAPVDETDR